MTGYSLKRHGQDKNGTPKWRVWISIGSGPQRKQPSRVFTAPNKRAAHRQAAIIAAQLDNQTQQLQPAVGTLSDIINTHIDQMRHEWSTAHTHSMTINGQKASDRIGHLPVNQITARHLDELYIDLLRTGAANGGPLSPRSVQLVHTVISSSLDRARRWGLIDHNPARDARPPTTPWIERDLAPVETIVELLDTEPDPMFKLLGWLAVVCGQRRSQLLGLRWDDIDLEAGVLVFRRAVVGVPDGRVEVKEMTKRGKLSSVHVDAVTLRMLGERRRAQVRLALAAGAVWGDGFVFTADPAGVEPFRPSWVSSWWDRRRADVAGLGAVKFHDLRHFSGSMLLAAGFDEAMVSKRLGNSRGVLRGVYAHTVADRDRAASEVMANLLAGNE